MHKAEHAATFSKTRSMANILLADDEATFRDLLKLILTADGHECEAVPDGESALDALRARGFDVFLCDLIMGTMSGIEAMVLARELRPDLKVIAVSGAAGYARQSGTNIPIGADALVTKPFKIGELTTAIDRILTD